MKHICPGLALLLTACLLTFRVYAEEPDLIIIGAGPAGLTAAQYIARYSPGTRIQIISSSARGQLQETDMVENWPGTRLVPGPELRAQMLELTLSFNNIRLVKDHIKRLSILDHQIWLEGSQDRYTAPLVLIASGAQPNLPAPLKPYLGKSVFTCTACDGNRFPDDTVLVIGGGTSAIESALALQNNHAHVHLAVRANTFKADKILLDRLSSASSPLARNPIKVYYRYSLDELSVNEQGAINGTLLKTENGDYSYVPVDGVFSATGQLPQTGFLIPEVKLSDKHIMRFSAEGSQWVHDSVPDFLYLLGNPDVPYANTLLAAARGSEAALTVSKKLLSTENSRQRVAVLGAGIGGKTAALNLAWAGMNVSLVVPENDDTVCRRLPHFWPQDRDRQTISDTLDQQLKQLNIEVIVGAFPITKDISPYDAVIANTLEYPSHALGLTEPVVYPDEREWNHSSQENILAAGDVAVQKNIPRQAIHAALSGMMAGRRILELLKETSTP